MNLELKGKKVLIVGASKGIGKATSIAFSKEGCSLLLLARSEELLNKLSKDCLVYGAKKCEYESVDLMLINTKEYSKDLLKKYGSFDIIIHCMGGSLTSRNIHGGYDDYLEALSFNALKAIDMNAIFITDMIKNKIEGHVVHVSSISAKYLRGNPLYASAKAFLNAYVTSAGRELAKDNIHLNSVMPGAVAFENSYWQRFIDEKHPRVEEFLYQHQACHRFGTPEEIADFILFISSPKCSFCYGNNLEVDGGNM